MMFTFLVQDDKLIATNKFISTEGTSALHTDSSYTIDDIVTVNGTEHYILYQWSDEIETSGYNLISFKKYMAEFK